MGTTLSRRQGPRYAHPAIDDAAASDALRSFRAMTDGLSSRLRFPSLASMRAGCVRSPHGITSLFLLAGRRAGLPRLWAEQFIAWMQGEVERIWSDQPLSLKDSRRRELQAECVGNQIEHETLVHGDTKPALVAELEARVSEIAAEVTVTAAIRQRIVQLEQSELRA